nr:hypothetical protein [Tanacetum cinerariifolium]
VLTSMDAATVLAGGINVPTAGPPAVDIHTGSDAVPTASPIVATATIIDAQVARELEEQQEREDKRITEQIARDAEVARIHAEKELQVWKLVEDFIPMGSKEEAERLKRKGFNLEQEKAKKQKTSEEVPDKGKSPEEIPEVKHPIIDWK